MADDVSDEAADSFGVDVRVKYDDSALNSDRVIRLFVDRTHFTHFCAVFTCYVWQICGGDCRREASLKPFWRNST